MIQQESKIPLSLKSMQGLIYKVSLNQPLKKRFGMIKDKKFKYYKDKTLKQLCCVIDFDRVQCTLVINEEV